ncbi:hypothetical protein JCM5353_006312 [Sporobolomyces roseus]
MHFSKIAISLLFLVLPTALSLAVSSPESLNSLDQRDISSTSTPDSTPSTPRSDPSKVEPNSPFYPPYRPPGRPWYPPYRPPYCRWQPRRYECRRGGGGYRPYDEGSSPSKRDEIVESPKLELNKRDLDTDGFYGGGGGSYYGGGYYGGGYERGRGFGYGREWGFGRGRGYGRGGYWKRDLDLDDDDAHLDYE